MRPRSASTARDLRCGRVSRPRRPAQPGPLAAPRSHPVSRPIPEQTCLRRLRRPAAIHQPNAATQRPGLSRTVKPRQPLIVKPDHDPSAARDLGRTSAACNGLCPSRPHGPLIPQKLAPDRAAPSSPSIRLRAGPAAPRTLPITTPTCWAARRAAQCSSRPAVARSCGGRATRLTGCIGGAMRSRSGQHRRKTLRRQLGWQPFSTPVSPSDVAHPGRSMSDRHLRRTVCEGSFPLRPAGESERGAGPPGPERPGPGPPQCAATGASRLLRCSGRCPSPRRRGHLPNVLPSTSSQQTGEDAAP